MPFDLGVCRDRMRLMLEGDLRSAINESASTQKKLIKQRTRIRRKHDLHRDSKRWIPCLEVLVPYMTNWPGPCLIQP